MSASRGSRCKRRPRTLVSACVVLAGVLLGACSSEDSAVDASSPAPSAAAPTPTGEDASGASTPSATETGAPSTSATPEVPEVLRFDASTVGGEEFSGASVAGRPVVVWFWAPWCPVCRSQAPEVAALVEAYGDDVAFVGVGALDGADAIAAFAEDAPGPIHLSDPDGELYQRFEVTEQSSFVVLDEGGREVLRTGYADDDAVADTVAGLVG